MSQSFGFKAVLSSRRRVRPNRPALQAAVEAVEPRRLFATFTVDNVNDSGPGSLRDAITLANADQTLDTIAFNIPGSGVQRISPLSALPDIISPVNIDGYTQPGSSPNTLAVGDDAKLLIEINGDSMPTDASYAGLHFDAFGFINSVDSSHSSVRGLIVNGLWENGAIRFDGDNNIYDVTITGNFIGTDATGQIEVDSLQDGLYISKGVGFQIGGTAIGDRNLLAGGLAGLHLSGSDNNRILNNYINVSADGKQQFGSFDGLQLRGSSDNVIGGTTPAARNLIGVPGTGITLADGSRRNHVMGNFIGVGPDGATPLIKPPSSSANGRGIAVYGGVPDNSVAASPQNIIGGPTAAEGNVVANVSIGIYVVQSQNSLTLIRHNSIFNAGQSIRLTSDTDSASGDMNDNKDVDVGANGLQNFATIINADATADNTHVQAVLNSEPNRPYVVDFFANPNDGDPLHGEARTWLAAVPVTTDASGNITFTADLPALPAGTYLTNTVTTLVNSPYGSTSQVSAAAEVVALMPPPPVVPSLSVANVSTSEGNSGTKTLTFTVKLSAAATGPVTVNYKTTDGTAKTSDNDYVAKTGALSFAAGETTKTVSITIKGDTKYESSESFNLLLSGATGATINDGSAVGSIINDDNAPALPKLSIGGFTATEGHSGTKAFTFKVTLDKSSTSVIKVNYGTQSDTASSASDYTGTSGVLTFAAGETVKTITVYVKGDKTKEADEKFYVLLSSPTNATISVAKATGLIKNDD